MAQINAQHAFQSALRHHQSGRLVEAQELYRQILAQWPDHVDALHHLGVIAHQMGQNEAAAELIGRALAISPGNAQAWNNLGAIFQAEGRLDEAADAFERAVNVGGKAPQTYKNLGSVLHRLGRFGDAAAAYRQALKMNASYVDALCGLSGALLARGQHTAGDTDEAEAACQRALALDHQCVDALVNMGAVCQESGEFEKAIDFYDRAIRLCPDSVEAHTSRGAIHLLLGHFQQGWEDYEWRLGKGGKGHGCDRTTWDGCNLAGRHILLRHEQGLGDTFQFIRYARVLQDRGAHVLFECPASLRRILSQTPGIERMVSVGELAPECDCRIPLLSVPGLCGTCLEDIPTPIPYIFADPVLVGEWKQRIAQLPGLKIGIVWQGNPNFRRDGSRSIPLRSFAPLADVPGVTLVALQQYVGVEQIAQLGGLFPIKDYQGVGEEADGFMRTAAIIASVDRVITSDTSVAHLAGAMGVPVWTALCSSPDWRWSLHRTDSPWYPTMRLFRQRARGDWNQVFCDMALALRQEME